jgi:hypothetical protein
MKNEYPEPILKFAKKFQIECVQEYLSNLAQEPCTITEASKWLKENPQDPKDRIKSIIRNYTDNFTFRNKQFRIARLDDITQRKLEKELDVLNKEYDHTLFAYNNESEAEPTKIFML